MEFKVYPEKLHNAATQMRELDGMYEEYINTIAEVKSILKQYSLDTSCESLGMINNKMETQKIKHMNSYNKLDDIARLYEECEKSIEGGKQGDIDLVLMKNNAEIDDDNGVRSLQPGVFTQSTGGTKTVFNVFNGTITETDAKGVSICYKLSNQEKLLFVKYITRGFSLAEIWSIYKNYKKIDGKIDSSVEKEILTEMTKLEMQKTREIMDDKSKDGIKPRKKNIPDDYYFYCGDLAVDQLRAKNLLPRDINIYKGAINGCEGKTLAERIANESSCHMEGVKYTYLKTYSEFEEKVKKGEPITNIVCSWGPSGSFKNSEGHGHAMLITRIENGMVYFMDNRGKNETVHMGNNPPQRQNGTNTPQCLSWADFRKYYMDGNDFRGATICEKTGA